MKKYHQPRAIFLLLAFLFISVFTACRKDFKFEQSITNLQISEQNILLPPVLNYSNTYTYLLKVYNSSNEDIEIPSIYLRKKQNSYYRINVDGRAGYEFNNVPLRAKDSLTIFLSIAAEKPSTDLYRDQIVFQDLKQTKEINLLTMIAKAKYYQPEKGQESLFLTQNTTFDNDMYHVISGNLVIAENAKLIIEAGTKVLFYEDGMLTAAPNASLEINGNLTQPVVFKTYKNEPKYDTIPSQWKGIHMERNSRLAMNYAEIIGAENAINIAQGANAVIKNTKIYNSGQNAIEAENAQIKAVNLVINNALQKGVFLKNGGDYEFSFCSISNFWNTGTWGAGENLPLYASNYFKEARNPLTLKINNTILYGNASNGIQLDLNQGVARNIRVRNTLIKNENPSELDLSTSIFSEIITENPNFKNVSFFSADLSLNEDSPALGKANPADVPASPLTIEGKERATPPNLGAY
uniref:right-handed parallel beta-helix repeat-containing protein n=1 Tax=Ornithobacterium rhinotracheale TaxID=28251 RepID=UPI0039A60FB5